MPRNTGRYIQARQRDREALTPMYVVTVTFEVDPAHVDAFMTRMLENARLSKELEDGCQVFDVCRDGTTVFLYELYTDRAAFDVHLNSAHFLSFDTSVKDMITSKSVRCFDEVHR